MVELLNNNMLLEAYNKSLKLNLDSEFIDSLKNELIVRGISVDENKQFHIL